MWNSNPLEKSHAATTHRNRMPLRCMDDLIDEVRELGMPGIEVPSTGVPTRPEPTSQHSGLSVLSVLIVRPRLISQ